MGACGCRLEAKWSIRSCRSSICRRAGSNLCPRKRGRPPGMKVKQPAFSEIVDRLHSSSAKGHTQSENREFVA